MSFCDNKDTPECVEYRNNHKSCMDAGGSTQYECVQLAKDRYSRLTGDFKDLVYPWKNFDWDYTRYIDNNYNAQATGANTDPTFTGLMKNTGAMLKISKGYIIDPNPGTVSQPAESDLTICSKVPQGDRQSCEVMNQIRQSYTSQSKPNLNSTGNFDNKPLDGLSSSSFYYKWGTCPTRDNKMDCEKKGSEWIDGHCYRPRYHYLKNRPGIDWTNLDDNGLTQLANKFGGLLRGNMPSVAGDIISMNPLQLGKVWLNQSQGDYEPEPCEPVNLANEDYGSQKKIVETFDNNLGDSYFRVVSAILGIVACLAIILFILKTH